MRLVRFRSSGRSRRCAVDQISLCGNRSVCTHRGGAEPLSTAGMALGSMALGGMALGGMALGSMVLGGMATVEVA